MSIAAIQNDTLDTETAALFARYGYAPTVKPSPPLLPGEAAIRERCRGMKAALGIERAVWQTTRGAPVTCAAITTLSTDIAAILATLEETNPEQRTARLFVRISQMIDRINAPGDPVKNAFRAKRGASEARKTAVREAAVKFAADVRALADDFVIDVNEASQHQISATDLISMVD